MHHRHAVRVTLAALLLAGSLALSGYSLEKLGGISSRQIDTKQDTAYISNAKFVNLRDGAGTHYKILSTLQEGMPLTVLGSKDGWSRVKLADGNTGFVANWLIDRQADKPPVSRATVLPDRGVNFRSGPGTDSSIQFALPKGAQVEVIGQTGSWYKVRYNGKEGYMASWLLGGGGSPGGANPGTPPGGSTAQEPPAGPAGTATGMAARIVGEANRQLGTRKYATAATDWGNLACAAYVSGVLKDSGAMRGNGSLNTVGLRGILEQQGWKRVSLSEMRPGDVLFWGPYPGGRHGHVGVIDGRQGGTWYSCDNSSSRRVPIKRPLDTRRPIVAILRHPGAS